jgi:hypothetical protein
MKYSDLRTAAAAQKYAPGLGSTLSVNPEVETVIAGVTRTEVSSTNLGAIMPVVISHTAGTAGDLIKIGDPDETVAAAWNLVPSETYTTSDYSPKQLSSFFRKGALLRSLNVEVSTASQFAQNFFYYTADVDSSAARKNIKGALTASKRATDQNTTIRTLDFGKLGGFLLLDHDNALFYTIQASATVTLSLTFQAIEK